MPERPILMFPEPAGIPRRDPLSGGRAGPAFPGARKQATKLLPRFRSLLSILRQRNLEFVVDPVGADPKEIIVLEVIGTVSEFYNAVRRIDGLKWLFDHQTESVEADEDYYFEDDPTSRVSRRVLIVSTNQSGLSELVRLFRLYRRGEELPDNLKILADLFKHLGDVRPWNIRDRISGTGIFEYIEELRKTENGSFFCTLELFSSGNPEEDELAVERVTRVVEASGGELLSSVCLSQIRHSEIRARIPLPHIPAIAALEQVQIFRLADVMFVRPIAQAIVSFDEEVEQEEASPVVAVLNRASPRIALFDGVPVQNHPALRGRLVMDDPDGFEAQAEASRRLHGTAMASLILNGDLALAEEPLREQIYVRPILVPRPAWAGKFIEEIPERFIPADVLHRAVARLFAQSDPYAPDVKVVCLCVADATRPFENQVSAWARIIDDLAWRYGLLFLVSGGNRFPRLRLPFSNIGAPDAPTPQEIDDAIVRGLVSNVNSRRILSPAESLNAVTVGASNVDGSTPDLRDFVPLSLDGSQRPSLYNPAGFGFRGSVKPEVFFRGGRQAFRIAVDNGESVLTGLERTRPPGQLVAAPPLTKAHIRGTSNATAIAARESLGILDVIPDILEGRALDRHLEVVLLKALLVHTAAWGSAKNVFERALRTNGDVRVQDIRRGVARHLGYGFARPQRAKECTGYRVTVVGSGRVENNHGLLFRFPLPPLMSSRRVKRLLTVTLAYLCPMNSASRLYRTHSLWTSVKFRGDDIETALGFKTVEAHRPFVRSGTIEHQKYDGEAAMAFVDGDSLEIQVNCKRDSGERVVAGIPFGLAVTLEVAEQTGMNIYEEVKQRLGVPVPVEAAAIRVSS